MNGWLTRAQLIEQTGLTEGEIDQMVLRGTLQGVRRPDLETLYDPASVEALKEKIREKP